MVHEGGLCLERTNSCTAELCLIASPHLSPGTQMTTSVTRRSGITPNGGVDADLATLLEQVCARLPHDYTRRLVRDVVRLKLEMGFVGDVRDYLERRSGDYPAVSPLPSQRGDS